MGGGLGGLTVVTRCGGGRGARGTKDSLEGPVSEVASPGSMASSTTGPTTSLNRPPSLLTSTCDLNDPVSSFTCSFLEASYVPFLLLPLLAPCFCFVTFKANAHPRLLRKSLKCNMANRDR